MSSDLGATGRLCRFALGLLSVCSAIVGQFGGNAGNAAIHGEVV